MGGAVSRLGVHRHRSADWLGRNAAQGDALRAIVQGDLVISVTGLVAAVLDRIYGSGNALVWSTFAIYLFLTVSFGYFQFAYTPNASKARDVAP